MARRPGTNGIMGTTGIDYEDFQPSFELKEESDAFLLHIQLPGYIKEQIKITYDESLRVIRVRGERMIADLKSSRFNQSHKIPENCILTEIKGKFEHGVLTITMPKRVTIPAKQMPKKTQEIPLNKPQEAAAITKQVSPKSEPKKTQVTPLKQPQEAAVISKPVPQMASEELQPKSASSPRKAKVGSSSGVVKSGDEKAAATSLGPQKGVTKSNSQKGNKESDPKSTNSSIEALGIQAGTPQAAEKKVEEEVTESTQQQKIMEKHKASVAKEKPMNSYAEKCNNIAASAVQTVNRLRGKLTEDEKQSLINITAAVIVIVAIGAHISYSFGGSSGKTRN